MKFFLVKGEQKFCRSLYFSKLTYFSFYCFQECFNCPYGNQYFPTYAENLSDSITFKMLSQSAAAHKVYLIGGKTNTNLSKKPILLPDLYELNKQKC
jgi:hypothetical protein